MLDGEIVMKERGNPSGTITTTVDNTLYHMFLVEYISYCIYGSSAKKNFFFGVYSDDGIFASNDEYFQKKYAEEMDKIGLITEYDISMDEAKVQFLGHRSVVKNKKFFPVLGTEKLLYSMAYKITESSSPVMLLAKSIGLYIEGYFNEEFKPLIEKYIKNLIYKNEYVFKYNSQWNGLCNLFKNKDYIESLYDEKE
jgi:hypothetical protein